MKRTYLLIVGLAAITWVASGCDDSDTPINRGMEAGADASSTDAGALDSTVVDSAVVVDQGGAADSASADLGVTADSTVADVGSSDMLADSGVVADAGTSVPQPVAYWSMDSADITGAVLKDGVGAFDGTITGATSDTSGKVGQALAFNGTDQLVDFGDVLDNVFAGENSSFTVSLWIKPTEPNTTAAVTLLAKNADNTCSPSESQRAFYLGITNNQKIALVYQPLKALNQQIIGTVDPIVADGSWIHVSVSYDGSIDTAPESRVRIYIDGAPQTLEVLLAQGTSFPFDLPDTTAHLGLGARLSSSGVVCGGAMFNGSVDELAIWSGALGDDVLAAVYQRGQSGVSLLP